MRMLRSKFYQFFPPPKFLQMPTVGLDISDTSIRFVELVEKRNGFVIGDFGERAIPRGVIESGEIKKTEALRAIFSELKKEYKLEYVAVSLPEEHTYIFELHLPLMKYSDVRGAIELEIEEYAPLKAEEALFDYDIITENESSIRVSVSVVPRTLVDGYLEAFLGSGITPVAFEPESHSIARAIVPAGDNSTCMIVDLGRTRTGIAVVSEGIVQFTSTVPVGGKLITDAMARKLKAMHSKVEKIKHGKATLGDNADEELSSKIASVVAVLQEEISRHMKYWQEHTDAYGSKRSAIQKIYLCGGGSDLVHIVNSLSVGLSCPLVLANTMINVNTIEESIQKISFHDSLRFATTLGLALRQLK